MSARTPRPPRREGALPPRRKGALPKKKKTAVGGRAERTRSAPADPPERPPAEAQAALEPVGQRPFGRADRRLAAALGLAAFLLFNLNFRTIAQGDSLPARFLPFAVLEQHSLYLDSVLDATRHRYVETYWIVAARNGHNASMYPVVTPLLVTPTYVPAWLYLRHVGWRPAALDLLGELMEKVAATVVASAAVALLFLALRRRLARPPALLLAALFAAGTNTWVIGSQGLWQHGSAELFCSVALLAMTGAPSWGNVLLAGAATGLLPANRVPDVLLALGFSLFAPFWARRRLPVFVLVAALPVLLTLVYTQRMFGNFTGGYGAQGVVEASRFAGPLLAGIGGLLISPGKGLFVFSPFLLFLPLYFRRSVADPPYRLLTLCLTLGVVLQILLYATTDWRAGYSWGPRFLTDLVPLLVWMLAPIFAALAPWPRRAFFAAALFSVAVQGVGAFFYQGTSDIRMYSGPGQPAWQLANTPYWVELRSGLAPMPFLRKPVSWLERHYLK
jgi:hypothetical protein